MSSVDIFVVVRHTGATPNKSVAVVITVVVASVVAPDNVELLTFVEGGCGVGAGEGFSVSNPVSTVAIVWVGYGVGFGVGGLGVGRGVCKTKKSVSTNTTMVAQG